MPSPLLRASHPFRCSHGKHLSSDMQLCIAQCIHSLLLADTYFLHCAPTALDPLSLTLATGLHWQVIGGACVGVALFISMIPLLTNPATKKRFQALVSCASSGVNMAWACAGRRAAECDRCARRACAWRADRRFEYEPVRVGARVRVRGCTTMQLHRAPLPQSLQAPRTSSMSRRVWQSVWLASWCQAQLGGSLRPLSTFLSTGG